MLVPVAVAAGVIALAGAGLWSWSSFGGKKNAPTGQTFDANSGARPAPAATPKTASPVTASPVTTPTTAVTTTVKPAVAANQAAVSAASPAVNNSNQAAVEPKIDTAGSLPNPADESASTALPSKPLAIAPVTPHTVPTAPETAATKSAHAVISAKKPSPAAQKHPKLTKAPPAQYKPIYHEAGSSVYHDRQSSDAIRDNEVWADKFSH
jgi:hypothetical protein